MNKRSKATQNTIFLTATNAFNRLVGFVYRIILIRIAGQEAVGLFQMVFPAYSLFLVLATAGLPIAVSKLVAEHQARNNQAGVRSVLRTAILTALTLGLGANALLFLLSHPLANNVMKDSRIYYALLIIAPSLPLVAVSAVFRGYFQGIQEIKVVCASLVTEQIAHVLATLGLVHLVLARGPVYLTAGLAAGSILGEFAGLTMYLISYPFFRPKTNGLTLQPALQVAHTLFSVAIPTTAARLVQSLSQLVQSILIPTRLRVAGFTASQAAIAFGQLTGIAFNLLFIPSLFTISLAATLLPQVSAACSRNSPEQASAAFLRALNWTTALSLPCTALFITLGEPLCLVLFNSRSAGQILSFLAWGGLLLYTQQIAAATLQGLGKPALPMIASVLGTLVGGVLLYVLTPLWQIQGTAIGLIIGFGVSGVVGLLMVERQLHFWQQWRPTLVRSILAAVMAGVVANTLYLHCLANSGRTFLCLVIAGCGSLLAYVAGGKLLRAF
jgi:stage V sporulation protein B